MGSEEISDDSSHVAAIARGVAASAASDVETAQTASEEESRPGAEAKEDGGFSTFSASDSVPLASLKALPEEEDENIRPGAFAVDGIDGAASSDGFTWNPNPPRVQSDRTVVQVDAVLVTDEPPQAMHDDVPYVDAAPIDTPWTLNFKSRGVQLLVGIFFVVLVGLIFGLGFAFGERGDEGGEESCAAPTLDPATSTAPDPTARPMPMLVATILGEPGDRLGWAVAMSSDGLTIASGAFNRSKVGHIRIDRLTVNDAGLPTGSLSQVGQILEGLERETTRADGPSRSPLAPTGVFWPWDLPVMTTGGEAPGSSNTCLGLLPSG